MSKRVAVLVEPVLVALMLVVQAAAAQAQAPTTAQRNAIRQACSRDYQAMCSGVPTGGRPALQCLQQNMSSLSPSCQSAVGAISPGAASGAAPYRPPQAATPASLRPAQACRGDFREFCGGVRPGSGRAMMCMREHAAELSPDCQESLQSLRR